jgi:hypothetical protein
MESEHGEKASWLEENIFVSFMLANIFYVEMWHWNRVGRSYEVVIMLVSSTCSLMNTLMSNRRVDQGSWKSPSAMRSSRQHGLRLSYANSDSSVAPHSSCLESS